MVNSYSEDGARIVTRRGVLKSVGTSGFALPAMAPVVRGSSGDETKITVVASESGPVVRKSVPTDWWEHEQRAKSVKKNLEQRFGIRPDRVATPGVVGVGLGKDDKTISGKHASTVRVSVNPKNKPSLYLPSKMDGIGIEVVEQGRGQPMDCNRQQYTPVPSGVGMDKAGFDEHYVFTTGCKVEVNNTPYMLTAAHLYDLGDNCNNSLGGKKAYQDQNLMGEVYNWDNEEDWVLIDKTGNETSGYEAGIEGLFAKQNGYVTENGLIDLKGDETTVYQMGISSCQTSGTVEVVKQREDSHSSCFNSFYAVGVDIHGENGDSGGPIYHKFTFNNNKYVSIIAPLWGGSSDGLLYGTGAFHLHNTHNMVFDLT